MSDGTPSLRQIDDDTLLDMYEDARANEDHQCDAISAELIWRGIEVQPCAMPKGSADLCDRYRGRCYAGSEQGQERKCHVPRGRRRAPSPRSLGVPTWHGGAFACLAASFGGDYRSAVRW